MNTDNKTKAMEWFKNMTIPTAQHYYIKYEHLIGSDRVITPEIKEAIYLSEHPEENEEPKDLIDWIGKVGLPQTESILAELKALNAEREKQQSSSVIEGLEDAAKNLALIAKDVTKDLIGFDGADKIDAAIDKVMNILNNK